MIERIISNMDVLNKPLEAMSIKAFEMIDLQKSELVELRARAERSRTKILKLEADVEFWKRQLEIERDRANEFLERSAGVSKIRRQPQATRSLCAIARLAL